MFSVMFPPTTVEYCPRGLSYVAACGMVAVLQRNGHSVGPAFGGFRDQEVDLSLSRGGMCFPSSDLGSTQGVGRHFTVAAWSMKGFERLDQDI